jgi:FHS family L-fucose permease-like MFS transporter
MIGQVIAGQTAIKDVNPVLFTAIAIFVAAFVILALIPIVEPQTIKKEEKFAHSPWNFRHFILGAIGIFVYVGIEVGIPGTLLFFLENTTGKGAGLDPATAAATAGFVAGTYWFMMMIGRFIGGAIGGKVSSKAMLSTASLLGIVFVLLFIFLPNSVQTSMPVWTGSSFGMVTGVPLGALFLVLCGLCTSIMWGGIFNLATEGLGKYIPAASGIFMMMVVGGGVLPLVQNGIADATTFHISYVVVIAGLAYLLWYALAGCKNVNKDIPVE